MYIIFRASNKYIHLKDISCMLINFLIKHLRNITHKYNACRTDYKLNFR